MSAPRPPTGYLLPPKRHATAAIILNLLGIAAMLWMLYEAIGIEHIFDYQGLSNDDAEAKAARDMAELVWDPAGLAATTFILVVSIVIHLIARHLAKPGRSTTTKVTMIISVVFYTLSFFRISMVIPLLFSAVGSVSATAQNEPDTRIPSAQELKIEESRLVVYHDTNGTRVTTVLTNATDEHWQSATIKITVLAADGAACTEGKVEEEWLAPGERREVVTSFLDPTDDFSDPSCVPENVKVSRVRVDVDSRKEIDPFEYTSSAAEPVFTSLSPVEETESHSSEVKVSVAGILAPESMKLRDRTGSLPRRFEIADAQGRRLAWCFEPGKVAEDGSFTTDEYLRRVDPGKFVKAITVPEC
ncbi:hypothetical protein [Microlunatus sp. GCM10028923]|uniref:hypothetical protein n=1 Tax=Microlunatus sp. GCM10028923 TaxID=3273400 RepID=UPI00361C2B3D